MTPYADFLYFAVLLYPIVPALLLGLMVRRMRWWILIATGGMLAIQYSGSLVILPPAAGAADSSGVPSPALLAVPILWFVAGYGAFQYAVARIFLLLRGRARKQWTFYLATFLAVAPLLGAKLLPLAVPHSTFAFIGISYITFRSVDAVIGIQDGLITALPPDQFLAYLFFFPTISSGPVDRYRRFAADWTRNRTRADFLADLDGGIHRIFTGFLYKFILAFLIKRHWMDPAAGGTGLLPMLSYMYAYSAYLFFDFAGYSAFAIGVGNMFGIHSL